MGLKIREGKGKLGRREGSRGIEGKEGKREGRKKGKVGGKKAEGKEGRKEGGKEERKEGRNGGKKERILFFSFCIHTFLSFPFSLRHPFLLFCVF